MAETTTILKNDLFEAYWNDADKPFEYYARVKRNNESIKLKINEKFEYYEESSSGQFNYLLDDTKLQKTNSKPSKAYGTHNPGQVFLRDNFWDLENVRYNLEPDIWFLDIETTSNARINADEAKETIVTIQIYDHKTRNIFILGLRESGFVELQDYSKYNVNLVKYLYCDNEKHLLESYFKLIKILKPLIVYAFNGANFDYPYLFKRAIKNNLEPEFSCFGKSELKENFNTDFKYSIQAPGIFYMDYLELYKKFIRDPRSSYSLDYITKVELGYNKINHDCFSNFNGFRTGESYIMPDTRPTDEFESKMYDAYIDKDYQKAKSIAYNQFIHYAIIDVVLLNDLDEKLQLTNVIIYLASIMAVNLDEALSTLKPWSNLINNYCYQKNVILPNKKENPKLPIKGGFVKDPLTGKHKWVISVDINSAYINLAIRAFNMSPETYLTDDKIPEDLLKLRNELFNDEDEDRRLNDYFSGKLTKFNDLLKKYNISAGVSGALFTKKITGVLPDLCAFFYNYRKQVKKEMLIAEQNIETIKHELHLREQGA